MNNIIRASLSFGIGMAIGVCGAYLYFKNKFDSELDERAQQIKKDFEDEYKKNIKPERDAFVKAKELAKASENKPAITNYTKMYSSDETIEVDSSSYEKKTSPRVISENDLYEGDGIKYAGATLILYSDGILTNDENEPVKKVKDIIGEEFLMKFYASENEDRIFVRNEEDLTDYEIIKNPDTYTSLIEEASEEED